MILFDNITETKAELLKERLGESLKSKNITFANISNYQPDETHEHVICVFSLTMGFFETDAFEFLKNQNDFSNLSIIIVSKVTRTGRLENAQYAIGWVNEIMKMKHKMYRIVAEVDTKDDDYLFEVIKSQFCTKKSESKNKVVIYTDGSCSGNPGPGGWGAILMTEGQSKEISGGEIETTNNRMELTSVIKALEHLKKPCSVELYSDSAYVVNAFELKWIDLWKRKHWRNSEKILVKNLDLWQKLDNLTQLHKVHFNKVKGHADNEFNNRCDELAVLETNKYAAELARIKAEQEANATEE